MIRQTDRLMLPPSDSLCRDEKKLWEHVRRVALTGPALSCFPQNIGFGNFSRKNLEASQEKKEDSILKLGKDFFCFFIPPLLLSTIQPPS